MTLQKGLPIFGIIFLTLLSCNKQSNSSANSLVGTWTFTNGMTLSYAYPSVLKNPNDIVGASTSSTTLNNTKIIFANNGSYTFSNLNYPIDNGQYSIAQDSFLVIKPDTSGLVKFNYTLPVIVSGSGTPPQLSPYYGFQYSTDTILFKIVNNKLVLEGSWISKSAKLLTPSNDTLQLNQVINYFNKN